MRDLPDGYVKLLAWFEQFIEPPANISIPAYVSNQTFYSFATSEATDKFRKEFYDHELHDPLRIVSNVGIIENAYENTPEKKRARERAEFFRQVAEQRKQEKGEQ